MPACVPRATTPARTPREFLARSGDVLIWRPDLAHRGLQISQKATPLSVVTHYCPKEVAPIYFEDGRRAEMREHEGVAWRSKPN